MDQKYVADLVSEGCIADGRSPSRRATGQTESRNVGSVPYVGPTALTDLYSPSREPGTRDGRPEGVGAGEWGGP